MGNLGRATRRWVAGLETRLLLLSRVGQVWGAKKRVGTTFDWMPEDGCPPLGLSLEPRLLVLLPLELLDAEMVLVDGDTQDHLGTVLVDDELVQVLPEHLGRDEAGAHIARVAERAPRGLVWLVEGRVALAAEVGAVEPRRPARVRRRQRQAGGARDGVEGEIRGAGLRGDGGGEGPLERAGEHRGGGGRWACRALHMTGRRAEYIGQVTRRCDSSRAALRLTVVEPRASPRRAEMRGKLHGCRCR